MKKENEKRSILRRIWDKIKFEAAMWLMDNDWKHEGGPLRQLYPPSFYYRHTPEEAERIVEQDIAELRSLINAAKRDAADSKEDSKPDSKTDSK